MVVWRGDGECVVSHANVVVLDGRGDVSALWGGVVISRRGGVSAYCGELEPAGPG
jgi:hypothetical protein